MADTLSTNQPEVKPEPTKAELIVAYYDADSKTRAELCVKYKVLRETFSASNHPTN